MRKRWWFAVRPDISQHCLAGLGEPLKDPFLSADEIAFAVGHRYVHLGHASEKNAVARSDKKVDPAIFEPAMAVVDERDKRPVFIRRDNQARFDQHLKAVADAEDQLVLHAELAYGVSEEVLEFRGEDFSGTNIVPIAESAGKHQDLEIAQKLGRFAEAVNVKSLDVGSCCFEGEDGLRIAVGARGPQDEYVRSGHVEKNPKNGSFVLDHYDMGSP